MSNRTNIIPLLIATAFILWALSCSTPTNAQDTPPPDCQPPCNAGERPACELAWASGVDAVFLGTVLDVKNLSDPTTKTRKVVAIVRVDEDFVGTLAGQVTVSSGGDSCGGFPFSKGVEYIFYARLNDKTTTYLVALCGGTKWAKEGSANLRYLRSIPSLPNSGTISGSVFEYLKPAPANSKLLRALRAATGSKVSISNKTMTYQSVVGRDGDFRSEGLPPGEYMVQIESKSSVYVETSTGTTTNDRGATATLKPKGCAQIDFFVDPFYHARR